MSMVIPGALAAAAMVSGIYIMMNKKTRKKAEKVINSAFNDIDTAIKSIQKWNKVFTLFFFFVKLMA